MLQLSMQWETGHKTARARERHDESLAKFLYNDSQKMMRLSENRQVSQKAYDDGYTMYHLGFTESDNPYTVK